MKWSTIHFTPSRTAFTLLITSSSCTTKPTTRTTPIKSSESSDITQQRLSCSFHSFLSNFLNYCSFPFFSCKCSLQLLLLWPAHKCTALHYLWFVCLFGRASIVHTGKQICKIKQNELWLLKRMNANEQLPHRMVHHQQCFSTPLQWLS